jgi:hypothetical protein
MLTLLETERVVCTPAHLHSVRDSTALFGSRAVTCAANHMTGPRYSLRSPDERLRLRAKPERGPGTMGER